MSLNEILSQIRSVRSGLHSAGTVPDDVLRAIQRHALKRRVERSIETGCGATTLLLSHLSKNHSVFALDVGRSVANVRQNPLLRPGVVTFFEGPTQRTLLKHKFNDQFQLALIDGPHAYPFPDLEYFFIYPHLEAGALLIIDDIQIRSINNLFNFLCNDRMFLLDEVVRQTAFFTRTNEPTFDPTGDNWADQGYNRQTILRYDWRSRISRALPRSVVAAAFTILNRFISGPAACSIKIMSPSHGQQVPGLGRVEGKLSGRTENTHLWILVHRKDIDGWWPQGAGPVQRFEGDWTQEVRYGCERDAGFDFEIAVVAVPNGPINENLLHWVASASNEPNYPPLPLPARSFVIASAFLTVTRAA